MCLTVAHLDLGAADVLLDTTEGLLVLRLDLAPAEQRRAARRILDAAGVEQTGHGVTCRCGEPLPVPGCDERSLRRVAARTFAVSTAVAVAATALAFNPSTAAADDPFGVPTWAATVERLDLECRYHETTARCTSSHLGPVRVVVDDTTAIADTEYTLESGADTMYVCRFHTTAARNEWVAQHPGDAEPLAERGALHTPIAMLDHAGSMS